MSLADTLIGRPLASDEDKDQRVGVAGGIPVFGLDALGSAAYGPEAALTVLIPAAAAGIVYVLPISISIVVLLGIVYFSYRQTIEAYPQGGGSYTVARRNLGSQMGLLAAAALMIDYLLNVAVGISTGIGALVSAVPSLQPHTLGMCLGVLLILVIINLRGVKETGGVFMAPTYLFIACLLGAIVWGVFKAIGSGGHPQAVVAPPKMAAAASGLGTWLIVKAFASGCTAMTGVEAVSNGVQSFCEPVVKTAQRTLTVIIAILMVMLLGIAYLVQAYHIGATEPGQAGYQSLLSMLLAAIAGKGVFYYVSIASILLVLSLSANTSFSAFPTLCHNVAQDNYLPAAFAFRGRRLVYTYGVVLLSIFSALLLWAFGGVTDKLIPLFAVGAFLSFTLSQAGMVQHWRKHPDSGSKLHLAINAVGAAATGITTLIVIVAKFTEGAWITIVFVPLVLGCMALVRRHYHRVNKAIISPSCLEINDLRPPLVVVPLEDWDRRAKKALHFALTLSPDVKVLHVDAGEQPGYLEKVWEEWACEPARSQQCAIPELIVIKSPYRLVVTPIRDYVMKLEEENPDRQIAVVIADLVVRKWYENFLHSRRAEALTAVLTFDGASRIVVVNVPFYLQG